MNTHHEPQDTAYEVVIPDEVWEQMKQLPPEAYDQVAAQIAEIRNNPDTVDGARPMVPHPVDHSEGRERVYVPATRSIGYLRGAVAEISPPTVAVFDEELREDTATTDPAQRIGGVRQFVYRWVEYIALQGDHDTARWLEAATSQQDFAERFREVMLRIHKEWFPDSPEPGRWDIRAQRTARGIRYVDPVTQLRAEAATENEAQERLRAAILSWVDG